MGSATASAAAPDDKDIKVHVQKDGAWVRVEVDFVVDATLAETWNVLTDYDHMHSIVSNVEQSKIVKRDGARLEVAQKGKAGVGPLSMSFENVREVTLTPLQEIRSRMISGDMKSSEFTTRISSEGSRTRVVNQGQYLPKIWVPPVVGPAFIEAETRKQFGELRTEVLRRKASPARPVAGN
jgi:carbon monoxide dehydrogenase subunit G